ncbi:SusC/RagA family TonB-linked outer membrane protein [Paraflavitalea sp. CAU 1676]|uniref:SusC/RagA family TonB-linked outer membrane protein n=1 Tax=Paraflavitalea sp. CAU 1676 TaxID=3032598 RepID=UPI0023DA0235|nr:SusC/RagA family TonB-linked outer membrane protein [Paraflavitalea sp. CAU 1676]MDF2188643.1 SusC/RagA family TonB-linked outer membrane protein [Paraflavitalea sp. CAU 1676]
MRKIVSLLLMGLLCAAALQAQKNIQGQVRDEEGKPVPYASIILKGQTKGTTADASGKFSVRNVPSQASLIFSSQGYLPIELPVEGTPSWIVVLKPGGNQLAEVVVTTALGVVRTQRSTGYANQKISAEKLTTTKLADINTALAGKVSGIQVRSGSGAKFGTSSIRLRGINTLGGGNPIYVVDGVIVNPDGINPDDVESLNVLKGPAATALYGQRGSEGAVVISIKKGTKKGIGVEFNHTTTFERVYILPDYQNEYGGGSSQTWGTFTYNPATHPAYLAPLNGAKTYRYDVDESWGPRMDGTLHAPWYAFDPTDPEFGQLKPFSPQPDNVRDFFRTGLANNTTVAFSKAGDASNTRLSFTNLSRTGVMPNSRQQKNFFTLLNSLDLNNKMTVGVNLNYVYENLFNVPDEGFGSQTTGSFNQWFQRNVETAKLKRYKRPDGTYTSWNITSPSNLAPKYWDNPYTEVNENIARTYSQRLFGNAYASYKILPGLKLSAIVRGNFSNSNTEARLASYTIQVERFGASQSKFRETNFLGTLEYEKNINDFTLNAGLFGELMTQQNESVSNSTSGGFIVPNVYNLSNSKNEKTATNSYSIKKVNSLYGFANIGYRNLLFLELSLRNDISSTLARNNNSYVYGSASGSFVFSEVIGANNWLSFGKLRASVARVGTDVGPYNTQATYALGNNYVKPVGATTVTYSTQSIPDRRPNDQLEPTLSTSYETGFDLRFLKNRVRMDLNYYFREAKGQIVPVNVPGSTGYASQLINAGNIRNYGFELTVGGTPVKRAGFTWDMDFNLGFNRNKVIELADGIDNIQTGLDGSNVTFGFVGSPAVSLNAKVNSPYGMIIGHGIKKDPATGRRLINDDGFYVTEDNLELGTVLPDFTGGFSNMINYKNFFLTFTLDFQKGGRFISITKMNNAGSGLSAETVGLNDRGKPKRDPVANGGGILLNGVNENTKKENDVYVDAQDLYEGALGSVWENWIYDGTYVKLREFSIGYQLPRSIFGKSGIQGASISLVGQNLWLIYSKTKGLDPSELEQSWMEGGQLPGTRSVGVNLKVNF